MYPGPPAADRADEISVRLAPQTRALLEEIKAVSGYSSDAEAIRAALAIQHHLAKRRAEGFRLYLGTLDGEITREVQWPK